jgi:hypothetical protein
MRTSRILMHAAPSTGPIAPHFHENPLLIWLPWYGKGSTLDFYRSGASRSRRHGPV